MRIAPHHLKAEWRHAALLLCVQPSLHLTIEQLEYQMIVAVVTEDEANLASAAGSPMMQQGEHLGIYAEGTMCRRYSRLKGTNHRLH